MNNSTDLTTPFLEFANLACLPGPRWATRSDYNACVPLQLSEEGEQVAEQEDKHHHHHDYHYHQENNPLFKYPYGNTIFAITTFLFYLFLMTIFFAWDKIFKEDGLLCTLFKSIPNPFPNPCCNPQSGDSDLGSNDRALVAQKESTRICSTQTKL